MTTTAARVRHLRRLERAIELRRGAVAPRHLQRVRRAIERGLQHSTDGVLEEG